MFNLINSQVYELQQQESLLLLDKQQQQQQQQYQNQQQKHQPNSKTSKMKNVNGHYSNGNTECNNNSNGAYNSKSLNNLTHLISNNNSDTNSRKKKSNYGSYYRQEKLKATANFIEKFLKNEVSSSSSSLHDTNKYQQQQQQQLQNQQSSLIEIDKQNHNNNNNNNCYNPSINFTYTYQSLNDYYPNSNYNDINNKNKSEFSNKDQNFKELFRQRIHNSNNSNNNNGEVINGNYNSIYHHDIEDGSGGDDIKRLNCIEDDNRFDITELGPNTLQIDHLNNLLDKNSSDTMPSLSPSQSSTDQSSSTTTTTTTATSSSTNNSLSTNDRISTATTTTLNDTTTVDRAIKKSQSSVLHRKKLLHVVTFLDQQNQRLERELQNEKTRRSEELSRIVKSLLYFEAKLKSEKKVINQKLYEKDDEIARLVRLNRTLKDKLQEKDGTNNPNENDDELECKYPESLHCSNCRKEFYGLNEKCDNWTQTNVKITDCRNICKGENNCNNNSNQNNNSTEHCSSSDETLSSSFYGARRSVRYTSKRTFGTFREYMRSRCMNIDDPAIINNNNLSEDENRSTLSRDEYPSQSITNYRKDKKFSTAIERLHGVRRVCSFEFDSSEAENRNHRKHFSSSGPDTDHEHTNSPNDEGIEDDDDVDEDDIEEEDEDFDDDDEKIYNHFEGANVGVTTTYNNIKDFSETSVKQDFETSTDDWYASASDGDDDQNSSVYRTKSYGYNAVNPVLECVNQILLQQSMEECVNEKVVSNRENHYDNNCNGPMSLDSNDNNTTGGFSNCSGGSNSNNNNNNNNNNKDNNNINSSSNNGSSSGTSSRKRVHFSTKNSMVHVPRDDDEIIEQKSCSFSDALNSSIGSEHQSNNLNYESIYSNEYEPIGSENNSSNLYVDMESKLDQDEKHNLKLKHLNQQQQQQHHNQQLQNKQPPALPPKPANLIKFKRGTKMTSNLTPPSQQNSIDTMPIQSTTSETKLTKELLDKVDCDKNYKYGTAEPDYCSISEVNVAIKTMQIVAEVHKSNDTNSVASSVATSVSGDNSDAMSQKTLDEEIFADIPKLPNVAAIIAPSKNKSNIKSPKSNIKDLSLKHDDSSNNFIQPQQHSSPLQSKQQLQQQHQQQHQSQQQIRPQSLQLYRPKSPGQVQRKHVPNILAEINKKIQQANNTTIAIHSPGSPNNKNNTNFILPINTIKRKQQSNQLLPILKSPSASIGGCVGGGVNLINTKNFNNILLGSQQNINTSPLSTNSICRSLKSVDSNKLNQQQQQQKLSSSSILSPKQQQKQINQYQSNPKQLQCNNKQNLQLQQSQQKQQQHLQKQQQQQQQQQTKIEDSLPLEAEFDWYNLDAEYCKSTNRPDIIKAAEVLNGCLDEYILANGGNLRDHHRSHLSTNDINQSVEYNLDEEFSLSNQPDIIKENIRTIDDRKLETIPSGSESESNSSTPKKSSPEKIDKECLPNNISADDVEEKEKLNKTIVTTEPIIINDETINNDIEENKLKDLNVSNDPLTVIDKFPTICDQTPCRQSINLKQKNFNDFIDNAGLSTKPLPQQRKIYFTGPFV